MSVKTTYTKFVDFLGKFKKKEEDIKFDINDKFLEPAGLDRSIFAVEYYALKKAPIIIQEGVREGNPKAYKDCLNATKQLNKIYTNLLKTHKKGRRLGLACLGISVGFGVAKYLGSVFGSPIQVLREPLDEALILIGSFSGSVCSYVKTDRIREDKIIIKMTNYYIKELEK